MKRVLVALLLVAIAVGVVTAQTANQNGEEVFVVGYNESGSNFDTTENITIYQYNRSNGSYTQASDRVEINSDSGRLVYLDRPDEDRMVFRSGNRTILFDEDGNVVSDRNWSSNAFGVTVTDGISGSTYWLVDITDNGTDLYEMSGDGNVDESYSFSSTFAYVTDVTSDRVYLGGFRNVTVIDKSDGSLAWSRNFSGSSGVAAIRAAGTTYVSDGYEAGATTIYEYSQNGQEQSVFAELNASRIWYTDGQVTSYNVVTDNYTVYDEDGNPTTNVSITTPIDVQDGELLAENGSLYLYSATSPGSGTNLSVPSGEEEIIAAAFGPDAVVGGGGDQSGFPFLPVAVGALVLVVVTGLAYVYFRDEEIEW